MTKTTQTMKRTGRKATKSANQKGKNFEREIAARIFDEYNQYPSWDLKEGSIIRTPRSGADQFEPTDILIRDPTFAVDFPFSIECKRDESYPQPVHLMAMANGKLKATNFQVAWKKIQAVAGSRNTIPL